jgi:hypothetical protein
LRQSQSYRFPSSLARLRIVQASSPSVAHTTSAPSGSSVPGPNW